MNFSTSSSSTPSPQGPPPIDNFRHYGSSLPVSPTSEHHVNAIALPSPPLPSHANGSFPTPPAPAHQSSFRYDIVLQGTVLYTHTVTCLELTIAYTHTHTTAPPSVAQRETFQLTYLNKSKLKLSPWFMQGTGLFLLLHPLLLLGQYYCIRLYDTEGYDGPLTSTLTLTFHEETHRRLAANYWRFWASQQKHPTMTRALDLSMSPFLPSFLL